MIFERVRHEDVRDFFAGRVRAFQHLMTLGDADVVCCCLQCGEITVHLSATNLYEPLRCLCGNAGGMAPTPD